MCIRVHFTCTHTAPRLYALRPRRFAASAVSHCCWLIDYIPRPRNGTATHSSAHMSTAPMPIMPLCIWSQRLRLRTVCLCCVCVCAHCGVFHGPLHSMIVRLTVMFSRNLNGDLCFALFFAPLRCIYARWSGPHGQCTFAARRLSTTCVCRANLLVAACVIFDVFTSCSGLADS